MLDEFVVWIKEKDPEKYSTCNDGEMPVNENNLF